MQRPEPLTPGRPAHAMYGQADIRPGGWHGDERPKVDTLKCRCIS